MSDEGSTPSPTLRDHRLDRRRAQQAPPASTPAPTSTSRAPACRASRTRRPRRQPLRRRHLLDGLGRRHGLHRRHADRPARRPAHDDDPQHRPRQRHVTATPRPAGSDGFFVLETSGGSATGDPVAHALPAAPGQRQGLRARLDAAARDHRRLRQRRDPRRPGQRHHPRRPRHRAVRPAGAPDTLLAQFGFGGRGDVIDAQRDTLGSPILDPRWVYTYVPDMTLGGDDRSTANAGEDVLIGGAVSDAIDGGTGDDLIFGDAVQLFRRDVTPGRRSALRRTAHHQPALPDASAARRSTASPTRRSARR